MTSHNQGPAPELPPISRIHPPNGIRTPITGGDAGPLPLDPNIVPRPALRPEDVPSRAAPQPAAPASAVIFAPQMAAPAPAPTETAWWLQPIPFEQVANVPLEQQMLWALGQQHLGRRTNADGSSMTREQIVAYYYAQDAATLGRVIQQHDAALMRLPKPAAIAQSGLALTPHHVQPVVDVPERKTVAIDDAAVAAFAGSQEARAVAIGVREMDSSDEVIGKTYGPVAVEYARRIRILDSVLAQPEPVQAPGEPTETFVRRRSAYLQMVADVRRATLPVEPASAPTQASIPVASAPSVSSETAAVGAGGHSARRFTKKMVEEAAALFKNGASDELVAEKLGFPADRIAQARRDWQAHGGIVTSTASPTQSEPAKTMTAAQALPADAPLMQMPRTEPQVSSLQQAVAQQEAQRALANALAEAAALRASVEGLTQKLMAVDKENMRLREQIEAARNTSSDTISDETILFTPNERIGLAMLLLVKIAGKAGVSFTQLAAVLEEIDSVGDPVRVDLLSTVRSLRAMDPGRS